MFQGKSKKIKESDHKKNSKTGLANQIRGSPGIAKREVSEEIKKKKT